MKAKKKAVKKTAKKRNRDKTHKGIWVLKGIAKVPARVCGAKGGKVLHYWKDSRSKKKVDCAHCLKLR